MEIFCRQGSVYRQTGFSLAELLVVLGIVAILMAMLLPNLISAKKEYKDSEKKQAMIKISRSLKLFYNDVKKYPDSMSPSDLGVTLSPYMTNIRGIGYTFEYTQTKNGKNYLLRVETGATPAVENFRSQEICGVGLSLANYYYVCAL